MSKILAFTKPPNKNSNNNLIHSSIDVQQAFIKRGNLGKSTISTISTIASLQFSRIRVSVVVPTRRRPQLLSRCLAGLVLQRFDRSRFEIIVVDDAPHHKTREIVIDWATHVARFGPAISYIALNGAHGPAAARNRGWEAARGDIIAFIDDDTVARIDWLEKGLSAFEDEEIQAVGGRIVMPLHHMPTDYELDAKGLERAEFVTANCFCRKAILEALGGFDETFRFAWREDADLYFRLLNAGAKIVHIPSAVIVHPIRQAVWGVSLAQQKRMLFDALLFKKHPALYRQKIRAKPRWDYYAIVLALLIALSGVVLRQPVVTWLAGGVWTILTVRFCAMRLRRTVKTSAHIGEMIVTSVLIPPLAVFWRVVGALKFRTCFV